MKFPNNTPKMSKKFNKQNSVRMDHGRPQHQIGSYMEVSDQTSDADMYMSGLSRPTNNDKTTADFMRSGPSDDDEPNRKSLNISNEKLYKNE